MYSSIPFEVGPFGHIRNQIFDQKGDLDVVFVGTSFLWVSTDVEYFQSQLTARLGRPAQVTLLGYRWKGQDPAYLILKEFFRRRRAKMVVILMPYDEEKSQLPHLQMYRLFSLQDAELMEGAGLRQKVSLYASAVLGMPRRLLSMIRPDRTSPQAYENHLGANKVELGAGIPYEPYIVPTVQVTPESMIFSEKSQSNFRFLGHPLNSYQQSIAQKIIDLCRQNSAHVVALNVPQFDDRRSPKVIERMNWRDVFGKDIDLVGIPPAVLWKGVSEPDMLKVDYGGHLNRNGNEHLTRTVTPALLEIYERLGTR